MSLLPFIDPLNLIGLIVPGVGGRSRRPSASISPVLNPVDALISRPEMDIGNVFGGIVDFGGGVIRQTGQTIGGFIQGVSGSDKPGFNPAFGDFASTFSSPFGLLTGAGLGTIALFGVGGIILLVIIARLVF